VFTIDRGYEREALNHVGSPQIELPRGSKKKVKVRRG